jgi:DNA-binding NarL/FixJ family response regulator
MRILLVDDDEGFRTTLCRLLTHRGRAVQVEEAADGEEALRIVAHRRPDVVVMDVTMPRMNGIEATRRLKVRWPDLPVVILTVHDDSVYERTARAAGADRFLLKKTAGTVLWPELVALVAEGRPAGPERASFAASPPVPDPPGIGRPPTRGDSLGPLGDRPDWQVGCRPL